MMLISSGEPKGEVAAGLRLLAPLAPARLGRGATCRLAEQRVPGLAIKRERDSDKSKVLAFSNFLKNHAKHHTAHVVVVLSEMPALQRALVRPQFRLPAVYDRGGARTFVY